MGENDAYADTVGQYLTTLAQSVWEEGEGFSGKRPFGNSGWDSEVYNALCIAGLMQGTQRDGEDGWWETDYTEERRINDLIREALQRARLVVT